ncbi:MAG: recombinase [Campylobacterales bacterium]|nr:recombinase [Campylobacterales bacterium]
MQEEFKKLLQSLDNDDLFVIEKLAYIIDFIRPLDVKELSDTLDAMEHVRGFFHSKESVAVSISDAINLWLIDSKTSSNITTLGILSRDGFRHETSERFYNKFLPSPPKKGDFKYLFATLFSKANDPVWVSAIEDAKWIAFLSAILSSQKYSQKVKDHLFTEFLYAAEILSIWIASEEFDENFIRLDDTLLNRDSAFIALQRDISDFARKVQAAKIDLESAEMDFQHIQVLIKQCSDQVTSLKKKSINRGISVDLTYELERLAQIIQRLKDVLELIKKFDTPESYPLLVELFKAAVQKNATRNSLYAIYQQNIKILAKSVTNNASEHGDHYITDNLRQYIRMFLSASGAGAVIAIMALIKIFILQAGLSEAVQTLLSSLNYGLGFVFIHMLGFTVATKQPAMTASTFAKAVEKGDKNKADQKKLVELIIQVNRSQFAAVMGNVILALAVSFGLAFLFMRFGEAILSSSQSAYYLQGLQPYPALLFAAIAGVWLFCSGLIAGYFDNRANLLDLQGRYFHHPLLKKILPNHTREKLSRYIHDNYGAFAGNFFFGILLGVTPFIGSLLNLPLDIRHVAFSTANLGYSTLHADLSVVEFLLSFVFVLMIGFVNLTVSFILALKVSLMSRDAYFGSFFSFLKLLVMESLKRPHHLFFPPKELKEEE